MLTLGIDGGLKGFLALLNTDGKIIGSWKMPLNKVNKFCPIETWKLFCEIDNIAANDFEEIFVCIEGLLCLPSDANQVTKLVQEIEKNPTKELFEQTYKQLRMSDGRVGVATQNKNFGILIGQIVAKGWRYITPSPRQWMSQMHNGIPGATTKIRSYNLCRSLWPDEDFTVGKRQGFNDGKCDASIIAEYARRTFKL